MDRADASSTLKHWALLPLIVITFLVFVPSLSGEFLDWDDGPLFVDNPFYRGLWPSNIYWMFTHATMGHYQPVTWLTWGMDYCLWGMHPFGYHLTSLLFHIMNAVLVYVLTMQLLRRAFASPASIGDDGLRWASIATAFLFAVHPLRAESVGWITERGGLLSTFFLLSAILCYLRYTETSKLRTRWFVLSLLLYSLSLLSKGWGMTLPVVLLILDAYPLRRWLTPHETPKQPTRSILLEKVPFAVIAILTAALAYYAKTRIGMLALENYGWPQRFAQAAYGLCFYLRKSIWPASLSPIYEIPVPFDPAARAFIFSGAACALLGLAIIWTRRRWPALAAAVMAYAISVSPALGLTQTGPQLVADRYTYLPCIPLTMLLGGVLYRLRRSGGGFRLAATIMTPAAVIALATASWTQSKVWQSPTTLWSRALELDPRSWTANGHLGAQHVKAGRKPEAVACFRAGLAARPDHPDGLTNLASVLAAMGETTESRSLLRKAVDLNPKNLRTLQAAAGTWTIMQEHAEAAALYRRALAIDPQDGRVQYDLALALMKLDKAADAAESFQRAVDLLEARMHQGAAGDTARLYLDACRRLVDFHSSRRDYSRAETYQRKIESFAPQR